MANVTGKIRYVKDINEEKFFPITHERGVIDSSGVTLETKLGNKQETLVSGVNIKTINGSSILGEGDIQVQTEITMDNQPTAGSPNPVKSGSLYSILEEKVGSEDVDNIVELSKADYNALPKKDPKTMYIVSDDTIESDHVGIAKLEQTTTSDEPGGSNIWTCTLTNNQQFTLIVKNGTQGNSGYSGAASELEVVNNVTSGGATAALSAEMGKQVNTKLYKTINSYDEFPYVLRKSTGSGQQIYDTASEQTRIRILRYIPSGTRGSLSTSDSGGVAAALYESYGTAANFSSTTGRLESYGGYSSSISFISSQPGYLGISLTNGDSAITDERFAELLASLTLSLVLPTKETQEITGLEDEITYKTLPLAGTQHVGYISNTYNKWKAEGACYIVPVSADAGKRLYVRGHDSWNTRYAFLKSSTFEIDTTPDYCAGAVLTTVSSGAYTIVPIPSDCNYIYFYASYNTSPGYPGRVGIVEGILSDALKIGDDLADSNATVGKITEGLYNLADFGSDAKTVVPTANETYNAYYKASLNLHFSDASVDQNAKRRLCYYPEAILAGGQTLTFTSTGYNAMVVYELPYRSLGTSPVNAFSTADIIAKTSIPTSGDDETYQITLQSATKRVAFVLGHTHNDLISPSAITDNITSVTLPVLDLSSASPKTDSQLTEIRQAKYVHSAPTIASLSLLHYSDIHGDNASAIKVNDFITRYGANIDAIVSTGDVVQYYADKTSSYPNASAWWKGCGLAEKSLFVLGNHDGAINSNEKGHLEGSADWDFKGKEWDFDTYFADYIEGLGITMPTGYDDSSSQYYKSCFWHKDFAAAKVRIIGLDCIHFNETFRYTSSEQETWLAARLADTLDSNNSAYGYSVIFLCHYPLDDWSGNNEEWNETTHKFDYNAKATGGRVIDYKTGAVSNFHLYSSNSLTLDKQFCMRTKEANQSAYYGYTKGATNPIGDIIQSWVDDGGKYVAWLCGHCHYDMLFYPARYPDLLCVTIDQAGNLRGNNITDRGIDLATHYCANFYSVDTQNGMFKIVRYGLTMDKYMTDRKVLCYDYINKKVINE